MIENATIIVETRIIKVRLHDHGSQPSKDIPPTTQPTYTGYLDGIPDDLAHLLQKCPTEINLVSGDELTVLTGIKWGAINNDSPDHAVLYLEWKTQETHKKPTRLPSGNPLDVRQFSKDA